MKHISIIFLTILGMMFTACTDDLELNPAQDLSTGEAIGDLDGLQTALNGAYDGMQRVGYYGREYLVIPEAEGNLTYLTISNSNRFVATYQYQWTTTDGDITDFWNIAYNTILRANNVINSVDNVDGDATIKSNVKGQAMAIRALCHFDLVRFFAKQYTNGTPGSDLGVPIITESGINEPVRNTVEEVYSFVVTELTAARALLDQANGTYRFTPNAIDALLARVNLYKGDYSKAASLAGGLVGNSAYSLATDVVAMFAGPGSSEEIFTLNVATSENNGSDNLGGIYNPITYGDLRVTTDLMDLYEPDDVRTQLIYEDGGEFYHSKFLAQEGTPGLYSPKILRLSEMYLIQAEASARGGDNTTAKNALNTLRTSRGASALPDGTDWVAATLAERQRELAYEGHTIFDYWRTGRTMVRQQCNTGLETSSPCSVEASSHLAVHPIPQREIDVNQNMVQNSGY